MRLLLDTHIFLWAVTGSPRLTASTRSLITEARVVHVSAVSIWEVAIKASLGKIDADAAALAAAIGPSGFTDLPVTAAHAAGVARLPPVHADPFDRLLIAQALAEPLRLLTADSLLAGYSDLVVVV
jgi:PIN domain nuclease of toxin-antitoxin system